MSRLAPYVSPFFFNDTATTEIYTLSLHDALPISDLQSLEDSNDLVFDACPAARRAPGRTRFRMRPGARRAARSEEHTSELQSRLHLVCRLLLEKKKKRQRSAHEPNAREEHGTEV